ncbi:Glyceraldehyde 3-phosphate phosphatase [uncultured archaeon]|nr:Glyceraldehyde 3-phosphate phosphatase [uncultured archaeon]
MLKAIIFDADHTLYKVVTKNAYAKMFDYISKETGINREAFERAWKNCVKEILNSKDAQSTEKRSREYSLRIVISQFGVGKGISEKAIKNALDIFRKQVLTDLEYEKDAKKTIAALQKKYTLAIASDECEPFLEMKLNRVFGKWRKYFKFIVSCETAGELKPSENYFKIALDKLKIPPQEAVVAGDSIERDITPAKKLGIKTVLISENNTDKAADFTIKSLSELGSALAKVIYCEFKEV